MYAVYETATGNLVSLAENKEDVADAEVLTERGLAAKYFPKNHDLATEDWDTTTQTFRALTAAELDARDPSRAAAREAEQRAAKRAEVLAQVGDPTVSSDQKVVALLALLAEQG